MNKIYKHRETLGIIMLFIVATIPGDDFLSTRYIVKSAIAGILAILVLFPMYWKKNIEKK